MTEPPKKLPTLSEQLHRAYQRDLAATQRRRAVGRFVLAGICAACALGIAVVMLTNTYGG